MISTIRKVGLTLAVLIALKLMATWITGTSPYFDQVIDEELDPSQMFYTESKEALKAEKEIGRKILDGRSDVLNHVTID